MRLYHFPYQTADISDEQKALLRDEVLDMHNELRALLRQRIEERNAEEEARRNASILGKLIMHVTGKAPEPSRVERNKEQAGNW